MKEREIEKLRRDIEKKQAKLKNLVYRARLNVDELSIEEYNGARGRALEEKKNALEIAEAHISDAVNWLLQAECSVSVPIKETV